MTGLGEPIASASVTIRSVTNVFPPSHGTSTTGESNFLRSCTACNKLENELSNPLKRCSRCKIARYCTASCQKRHWKTHKHVCGKEVPQLASSSVDTLKDCLRRGLPIPESLVHVVSFEELLDHWNNLKTSQQLVPAETSSQIQSEIVDMACQINSSKFPDLSKFNLVGYHIGNPLISKEKLSNLIYEMVLAYLLSLRLDKTGWHWLKIGWESKAHCITEKVITAVLMSRFWISNVNFVNTPTNPYSLQSNVLEKQTQGLLTFAKTIAWPWLDDTARYLGSIGDPDALRLSEDTSLTMLWDWLYGLVLPGDRFAHKIMGALVQATPQIQHFGLPGTSSYGLLLSDRSYWRLSSIMGRVMGGLKGVKSAQGWIGPCPKLENMRETGWFRVITPHKLFPNSTYLGEEHEDLPDDLGALNIQPGEDPWRHLEELEDVSQYHLPVPLSQSTTACKLRSLEVSELTAYQKDQNDPGRNLNISLTFEVNGVLTSFTPSSTIAFVAAHPCLEGPHPIHSRQVPEFENVWEVDRLKDAPTPSNQTSVMIINATSGDGELLARAWCAEIGAHAVIRREGLTPTCITCARRMASNTSLGTNVLIWS